MTAPLPARLIERSLRRVSSPTTQLLPLTPRPGGNMEEKTSRVD